VIGIVTPNDIIPVKQRTHTLLRSRQELSDIPRKATMS
jgi:hypothetical protein